METRTDEMRVFVSAGHSRHADNEEGLIWEHTRCAEASDVLLKMLRDANIEAISPCPSVFGQRSSDALTEKIDLINASNCDLAVELRLASGGGNYGRTVFWSDGEQESEQGAWASELIASSMEELLPWRFDWVSMTDMGRGNMKFLDKSNCPSVVCEPAFKDHSLHLDWIDSKQFVTDYASSVYIGIRSFLMESKGHAQRPPSPPKLTVIE